MKKINQKIPLCLLISLNICSINLYSQNIDIRLLKEINLNRKKSSDPVFMFITNSVSPVSVAIPIAIFSVGLFYKDCFLKSKGVYIGETVLVSDLIVTALKYTVNRDRPFITYPYIEKASSGGSPSFPSGHTSDAFSTATSVSIAFPKWYVVTPTLLWASAVGYSRICLGVHYPSDVLAGAIIGCGSAYLTYQINCWINKKTKKEILFQK